MNVLTDGLRGVGQMLTLGLWLLGRHWPQLLTLYLAGAAGRMTALWLALWASKFSSLLGVLLMPLAPLCTLMSLVFMLRVLSESLPVFREHYLGNMDARWKENLRVAAQVLIPFLAVYASQGLLKEDITQFIYNATVDESLNNPLSPNYARTLIASGGVLIGVVLLGMTLRKWIAANKLAEKTVAWGALGGYVEALWMVTLSASLASRIGELRDWVTSRAVVDGALQLHQRVKDTPGVIGQTWTHVVSWLGDLLGGMGGLVVVPVAWLAIGAMIYGRKLTARALPTFPTHEQVTERLKRIPDPVTKFVTQAVEPVTTPVQNTVKAVSKVAAAGVLPMVLFCIAFSLLGRLLSLLVASVSHALIGPQPALWQAALEPYVALVQRGASLTVTVVLVAAAVNRIAHAEQEQQVKTELQETAPAPA